MLGYPVELNLVGRRALVVGLGAVGRRRAQALAEAGAHVLAVDPAAGSLVPGLPLGIKVVPAPYHADLLEGAFLVVAAGPPEVNRQVVADAQGKGILVSSASDPDQGDFTLPAVWRSGPVVLTVSTSGASPALARVLRDQAVLALSPAACGLAELLAELRPQVIARLADPRARRRVFREWAHPRWLALWDEQGQNAVRTALWQRVEEERRTSMDETPPSSASCRVDEAEG
jgi:siroheme synthase-like protein